MEKRAGFGDPVQQSKMDRFFNTESKIGEKKQGLADLSLNKRNMGRFEERWGKRGFQKVGFDNFSNSQPSGMQKDN